jgi:hypothetical protein
MFRRCLQSQLFTSRLVLGFLLIIVSARSADCQTSEAAHDEDLPRAHADDLVARFRDKEQMIDGRIRIGTASPALKTAWLALKAEAGKRNRLLSLREYANYVVSKQFAFEDRDSAALQGLYTSIQSPSPQVVGLVNAHRSRSSAVGPARYSYTVDSHGRLPRFELQQFCDGRNASLTGRAVGEAGIRNYSVTATDGERLMRFAREGPDCDAPIRRPRETWNADITPFRNYSQCFRADDPLRLYFPDGFEETYSISGTVSPIAKMMEGGAVWETLDVVDGKDAVFVGTPFRLFAFDTTQGDLLLFSIGEYRLSRDSDRNLLNGDPQRLNRVRFKKHREFAGFGRLPTALSITIGTTVTDVRLDDIERAGPAGEDFIEEMIPQNAYVLDRIRRVKYIKAMSASAFTPRRLDQQYRTAQDLAADVQRRFGQ